MTDRIGTTEARQEGFYWVVLGKSPPEIAFWARGEWWLTGETTPWRPGRYSPSIARTNTDNRRETSCRS
jgi:hypothetical protein